jgi:hypothetical protein
MSSIPIDGPSIKLSEFWKLENMSATTFYKIPEDIRPRVFQIPGTTIQIITAKERRRYHDRLEKWQKDHAAELEAERARRSERYSELGRRAVASPRHWCRLSKKQRAAKRAKVA